MVVFAPVLEEVRWVEVRWFEVHWVPYRVPMLDFHWDIWLVHPISRWMLVRRAA